MIGMLFLECAECVRRTGVASLTTAAQIGISVQTLTSAQVGPIDIKL